MQEACCVPTKSSLSEPRAELIGLMQRINFGCIEDLIVRQGEPVMDPMPRVIHQIKFQGENGPRPESVKADFALKAQVIDLFARLESIGDGVIRSLEIQRGLPFRMTVEEVNA